MISKVKQRHKREVSQADIARMAGVDQSTVSYALKGGANVSPKTQQRILEIIRKVNYRPNAHARSLRVGRSELIGVVTSPVSHLFQAHLVDHIASRLRDLGLQMILRSLYTDQEKNREQVMELLDRRAAGVIVETTQPTLYREFPIILGQRIPLVIIGPMLEGTPSVTSDRLNAGRMVAAHLLSLRRRRLATLTLSSVPRDGGPRFDGFRSAASESDMDVFDLLVPEGWGNPSQPESLGAHPIELGYEAARHLREQRPDVDAIFCVNDESAMGLVSGLRDLGVRVPQDVAVVGFDDVPHARHAAVPLTTIRQPTDEYADVAVQMLKAQLEQDPGFVPEAKMLRCELIVRASTDPAWSASADRVGTDRTAVGRA